MVQAVQAKRWGKVHALQHLLNPLVQRKALAVKRVTTNDGSKTPGVDDMVWDTPAQKACAIEALRQCGYRACRFGASPFLQQMHGSPTSFVDPDEARSCDAGAVPPRARSHCGNARRPKLVWLPDRALHRGCDRQCCNVLARQHAPPWILEGDIRACFDGMSHEWSWPTSRWTKPLLHKWLKAGFIDKHLLYPTEAGVPQGACAPR